MGLAGYSGKLGEIPEMGSLGQKITELGGTLHINSKRCTNFRGRIFRKFSRTFRNVRRSKRSENDSERSETAQNGAKTVRNGATMVQNDAKTVLGWPPRAS